MDTFQDDPTITDDETVIRRVSHGQQIFDQRIGRRRPTTQAFRQDRPDGLTSVYLLSETTPAAIAGEGLQEYQAAVRVGVLRENGLGVIRTPESGGPGHCDITGRKTRGALTPIVRLAQWVPGYEPPPCPDDRSLTP